MTENIPGGTVELERGLASRLLALPDGLCLRLYIYLRLKGLSLSGFDYPAAAAELDVSVGQLKRASAALRPAVEDTSSLPEAPAVPARRLPVPAGADTPEYRPDEVARFVNGDGGFRWVTQFAERTLGRLLSTPDTQILLRLYNHYGFTPDVICLLLTHCVESSREPGGSGRTVTMRSVEKEAIFWYDCGVTSLDEAEEHIKRQTRVVGLRRSVISLLGLERLSPSQQTYIDSWIGMGFDSEAIAVAYDRTMLRTGGLKWEYMNSILKSWNEQGLHTRAEVESEKPPVRKTGKDAPAAPARPEYDAETLRRNYEKLRQG